MPRTVGEVSRFLRFEEPGPTNLLATEQDAGSHHFAPAGKKIQPAKKTVGAFDVVACPRSEPRANDGTCGSLRQPSW